MELAKEKRGRFLQCLFCCKEIFFNICILFQCLLNKLSEYLYFYISKHITYTLLLPVFKIAKSLQRILNIRSKIWWRSLPKYNDFRDLWAITNPSGEWLAQRQQWKQSDLWNLFKGNNNRNQNDVTHFTRCGVLVIDFQQVNESLK